MFMLADSGQSGALLPGLRCPGQPAGALAPSFKSLQCLSNRQVVPGAQMAKQGQSMPGAHSTMYAKQMHTPKPPRCSLLLPGASRSPPCRRRVEATLGGQDKKRAPLEAAPPQ